MEDHTCYFSDSRRKDLNTFLDAIESEGADHETHIYILRIGNNFKSFIKKSGQYITWLFLLAIVILVMQIMGMHINPMRWFK